VFRTLPPGFGTLVNGPNLIRKGVDDRRREAKYRDDNGLEENFAYVETFSRLLHRLRRPSLDLRPRRHSRYPVLLELPLRSPLLLLPEQNENVPKLYDGA